MLRLRGRGAGRTQKGATIRIAHILHTARLVSQTSVTSGTAPVGCEVSQRRRQQSAGAVPGDQTAHRRTRLPAIVS